MRIPAQLHQTLISAGVVGSFVGVLCAVASVAFYPEYAPPIASGPDGLWENIVDAIGTFLVVTAGIVLAFGVLPAAISHALGRRLHQTGRTGPTAVPRRAMAPTTRVSTPAKHCDCAELGDVVPCADGEHTALVLLRRLRFLRERCGARLYLCMACSTSWQVDYRERGPQARRIGNPFRWQPSADTPVRHHVM